MKLLKRTLSACLALAIGASSAICANAETAKNSGTDGLIVDDGSAYKAYVNSLSKEDNAKLAKKKAAFARFEKQESKKGDLKVLGATKLTIPGTFTLYHQNKWYYCAPACVQSVLKYINGSAPSQDTIAKGLGTSESAGGTSMSKIAGYLNDKQSDCWYVLSSNPSQTSMCNAINYTITKEKDPCIMGIVDRYANYWHYATYGHAIIANGIMSDKSEIQISDPDWNKDKGYEPFYMKKSSTVSNVCIGVIY